MARQNRCVVKNVPCARSQMQQRLKYVQHVLLVLTTARWGALFATSAVLDVMAVAKVAKNALLAMLAAKRTRILRDAAAVLLARPRGRTVPQPARPVTWANTESQTAPAYSALPAFIRMTKNLSSVKIAQTIKYPTTHKLRAKNRRILFRAIATANS